MYRTKIEVEVCLMEPHLQNYEPISTGNQNIIKKMEYKWIEIKRVQFEGLTQRYEVFAKSNQSLLGRIQFYPGWRRYVFQPTFPSTFEEECLKDIAEFVEALTIKYKTAARLPKTTMGTMEKTNFNDC